MRLRPRHAVLAGVALVLAGTVLEPLARMAATSFDGDAARRWSDLFSGRPFREAAANSLGLALLTVAAGLALGGGLAFLTHGLGRAGAVLRGLALAPVFIPPVLGTIAFYFATAPGGPVARLAGGGEFEFRGLGAVLAVHAFTLFVPFLVFITAGLARIDPDLPAAARTLGASRLRVFATVTLPLLRPALAGAAALTFMGAMASFTAPWVFDTGSRYLTTAIVLAATDDPREGAAYSVVLAALSLLAVAALRSPGRPVAAAGRGPGAGVARPGRAARSLRIGSAAVLVAAILLPFLTLVLLSLRPDGRLAAGSSFEGLGLDHYRTILAGLADPRAAGPSAELVAAIGRSAVYALGATAADVIIALALVLAAARAPRAVRAGLDLAAMLPFAVPGTVVGIAMMTTFATRGPLGLGGPMLGTAWILVTAYFVRNLPLLTRAVASGVEQMPAALPEAARSLGAGPIRALRTVILPLLAPALLGGALLAFVAAIGEFVASILLYAPATRPAAVAIYDDFRAGLFGPAAAAGVLLSLATLLILLAARLLARRARVA